MKQEIKERVERIRKGEVPEGYRMTKNWIIPSNWDETIFSSMVDGFSSGSTPSRNNKSFFKGDNLWITSAELNYNIIKNSNEKITDEAIKKANLKVLNPGTFVIAITGLEAAGTRGSCGIVGKKLTTSQSCMALIPESNLDLNFLFQFYCAFGEKIALKYTQGTKQQSYNGDLVRKLPIIKVPLNEQKKITEILYLWDKAIELKEKIIEEKKTFKRGLMQKLLTGEMRFPEFTGDWEETRLGKKLTFIKKESIENPQNYRLLKVKLHLKGIEATENYPKSTENGRPYHLRCEGELLIGRQNFHNGGIGIIPKGMNGYIASNAISSLKSSDDNLMHYYYYLSNPNFYKKVGHFIGGTGQKEISESMFKNLKITLPSNDEEIKKISATIKTIYQDLEMENNILSQLKEQKRGLMQLLLTGIVRVEVD